MPRTREITDPDLLDRLMDVFRRRGYEGASLTLLADASGLSRASLYHRFPDGKPQMAEAVLDHAEALLVEHALTPLERSGEDPRERVRAMGDALAAFYRAGRRSCLLDTLSFGEEDSAIRVRVEAMMERWIEALARVVRKSGVPDADARERAEDAIAALEGSLVMARATGETRAFDRAIEALPRTLFPEDERA